MDLTLVFTDIEASTRLLQTQGPETFARLLRDHRDLLGGAWQANGGTVRGLEGDGCLVSFTDPEAALRACSEAQLALRHLVCPPGAEVKVRMGVHSGEVHSVGGDLIGLAVHLAARVAGSAHGGQVVVSGAVRDRVASTFSLLDLGEHRLKDIEGTEHLAQLVVEGAPQHFPPPKTLSVRSNNLPSERTPFIGREDEVRTGFELLGRGRLVTITGPGGVGKTRLAAEIAAALAPQFDDGVWCCWLDAATDRAGVVSALLRAVSARELPNLDPLESLLTHLRKATTLLLLDNAEHVLEPVAELVEVLLDQCPRVRILVTSQETLRAPGEHVLRVNPLCTPERPDRDNALRIFFGAVLRADPLGTIDEADQAAAVTICERLDGLPLALELAAARAPSLGLRTLAERIDSLNAMPPARGGPPRHRSLQATLEWSHDLLADVERAVLRRLSVCADEGDLGLAEAVCGGAGVDPREVAGTIAALIDKSLLVGLRGGRWRMLKTVAAYASERLAEAGETAACQLRHIEAVAAICAETEAQLLTDRRDSLVRRTQALEANLSLALERATALGMATEPLRRVVVSLARIYLIRGSVLDPERVFGPLAVSGQPAAAAGASALAWLKMWSGASDCAADAAAAIRLARRLGDPRSEAEAWRVMAHVSLERERPRLADLALRHALPLAKVTDMGMWLNLMGTHADVFVALGHHACALALLDHLLPLAAPTNNHQIVGMIHCRIALLHDSLGHRDEVLHHATLSINHQRRSGYGGSAVTDSIVLAENLRALGRTRESLETIEEILGVTIAESHRTLLPIGYRGVLAVLCSIAVSRGLPIAAAELWDSVAAATVTARREQRGELLVAGLETALAEVHRAPALALPLTQLLTAARDLCRELIAMGS